MKKIMFILKILKREKVDIAGSCMAATICAMKTFQQPLQMVIIDNPTYMGYTMGDTLQMSFRLFPSNIVTVEKFQEMIFPLNCSIVGRQDPNFWLWRI